MSRKPLFETADAEGQGRRRLLLVSYHFPPDSAVGARRWEKLAHYVAARGWGLDVVMHRDPDAALSGAERVRLERLPAGVRVYGVASRPIAAERAERLVWRGVNALRSRASRDGHGDGHGPLPASDTAAGGVVAPASPQSIARDEIGWGVTSPRGWMRAYWAWLEFATVGAWAKDAADAAVAIVRGRGLGVHAAVVTSGPPHMIHDAGRRVAERTGLAFVMDMRDPWSHAERLSEATASPAWFALAARCEARAVGRAALVVANTELSARNLRATYPSRRGDIIVAMNGTDDDPLPVPRRTGCFVVAHAGTVYLDRDPRGLFQAAGRVVRELSLTPADFRLEFIGELEAVGGFPIHDVARQEGIAEYVVTGPPRPHAAAMQFMADATMLVTMSGTNMAAIPAKTFECMRFDAWLLALSASGSATELLLAGTGADVLAPWDVDGITAALRRRYQEHAAGARPPRIADSGAFSRASQARILLDAIQDRVGA